MKAWQAWVDDSEKGSAIVFADTRNEARLKAQCTDACEDERYIDISVKRLPILDGMEDRQPSDNLWFNDEVRTILVKECGWQCYEPNEWEDCEKCCAKQWCGAYEVTE